MVAIFCPSHRCVYFSRELDERRLMAAVKRYCGNVRMPRGSLIIRKRSDLKVPRFLTTAKELNNMGQLMGVHDISADFPEGGGDVPSPKLPDTGLKAGDRVRLARGDRWTGTVVRPCGVHNMAEVLRDDGVRGGGPDGTWLIDPSNLELIAKGPEPKKPVPDHAPGSLDAVITAVATEAALEAVKGIGIDEVAVREIATEVAKEIGLGIPKAVEIIIKKPDMPDIKIDTPHYKLEEVIKVMQADPASPIMLVGPAGTGKSTLCEQAAEALGVGFLYTPQTNHKSDIVGHYGLKGEFHKTPFYVAFRGPNMLHLFDEIDGYSANASLAANAGMDRKGKMVFPDSPDPVSRGENVYLLAAANTWGAGADREYVGRNQLDSATLNRFIQIPVDYDRALEAKLCDVGKWLDTVWKVRDKCREFRLRHVISTRQVLQGQALIKAGQEFEYVTNLILRRDLSDTDWNRVKVS